MNELLDRMKKNEKPFGLLTEVEKQCLKDNNGHIEKYRTWGWEFVPNVNFHCPNFDINYSHFTFRIDPNYNPEPEIPVLEGYVLEKVYPNGGGLFFCDEIEISKAMDAFDFAGYGYKLKGKVGIIRTGQSVVYTNTNETDFNLISGATYDISKRPDYVVFKEINNG